MIMTKNKTYWVIEYKPTNWPDEWWRYDENFKSSIEARTHWASRGRTNEHRFIRIDQTTTETIEAKDDE